MKNAIRVRQDQFIFLLDLVQNPNVNRISKFYEWLLLDKINQFYGSDQFLMDHPDGPKEPKIDEFLSGIEEVVSILKKVKGDLSSNNVLRPSWTSLVHHGIQLPGTISLIIDPYDNKFILNTEDEYLWNKKKPNDFIFFSLLLNNKIKQKYRIKT